MKITLTPEFFCIAEGKNLEGMACADCQSEFDSSPNQIAYIPKFSSIWIVSGELYHQSCIENLIQLENLGR